MTRILKERKFSGTTDPKVQPWELEHRKVARRAAAEGIVLLKNEDHILPLKAGSKVALYGAGAGRTIKGGTGSGDVNERERVSVFQGMKNAGFQVTTEAWIESYDQIYENARQEKVQIPWISLRYTAPLPLRCRQEIRSRNQPKEKIQKTRSMF